MLGPKPTRNNRAKAALRCLDATAIVNFAASLPAEQRQLERQAILNLQSLAS